MRALISRLTLDHLEFQFEAALQNDFAVIPVLNELFQRQALAFEPIPHQIMRPVLCWFNEDAMVVNGFFHGTSLTPVSLAKLILTVVISNKYVTIKPEAAPIISNPIRSWVSIRHTPITAFVLICFDSHPFRPRIKVLVSIVLKISVNSYV